MSSRGRPRQENLWGVHDAQWRSPAQVVGFWEFASATDPGLLRHRVRGPWWDLIAELGLTLIITREYEHLVVAMCVREGNPVVTYLRIPHPSGLVADRDGGRLFLASTRNPNQVVILRPVEAGTGDDSPQHDPGCRNPFLPLRTFFLPGRTYLHDLAIVGGRLHGNAVGQNAVVRLDDDGGSERVWWPRCIETPDGPDFTHNYLQLNSIAAGPDLASSFFSASTDRVSRLRPGHRRFPVDGRGVLFSGRTAEPVCRGLTRPHSARLHHGRVWVANSGYGELCVVNEGRADVAAVLPGWTRGLCLVDRGLGLAFVGTSRVIPRFQQYAPGLGVDHSECGIHAVDIASGRTIASLSWPQGNQVFAVDWVSSRLSRGLPFPAGRRSSESRLRSLFYSFRVAGVAEEHEP